MVDLIYENSSVRMQVTNSKGVAMHNLQQLEQYFINIILLTFVELCMTIHFLLVISAP